ncbi:MAG: two-component system, sensor histidine kinase PdtaS [Sphingomonadales bacterium]|nr:two-component system, sensor histidine kinase PdtaS [Sphingomonadales bacterium]
MSDTGTGWIASRYARLSTGLKMLLILSVSLLPLGLIAILASVQSARQKSEDRREETLARLEIRAQRLNAAFARSVITIHTASTAISLSPAGSTLCGTMLHRLEAQPVPARYALFAGGAAVRCASPGFASQPAARRAGPESVRAEILPGGAALRLVIFGGTGQPEGVVEYSRDALSKLTMIADTSSEFDLDLIQPGRRMILRHQYRPGPFRQTVRGVHPVADGQLQLGITLSAIPITATDLAMILLPIFMWLLAALIGWLILDRLLLQPLARMQRAIAAYRPGEAGFEPPRLATPAREIGELGRAFDQVVRTVSRHEAELEAAVERQKKLVREVHHRVKNNLQVVASLLNLHSRGSANEEVAAAYASIQRRVDALAVVHRNHYAELEENRGVALKPLISELAANLRATAPSSAAAMMIRLDLDPFYVTQDVAVSVAFLITEIAEFAMLCGAASVAISLRGRGQARTASLVIESGSLKAGVACAPVLTERFERIVTGLSRQLRTAIERDPEAGRYSLDIAVVDRAV